MDDMEFESALELLRGYSRWAGKPTVLEIAAEELERLRPIEAAARKVVAAFEALGKTQHAGSLLMERGNCETAMAALKAALFNTHINAAEGVR